MGNFTLKVSFKDGHVEFYNNMLRVSPNIDRILKKNIKDTVRSIESTNNLTGYKGLYYNTVEPKLTEKNAEIAIKNIKQFLGRNEKKSLYVQLDIISVSWILITNIKTYSFHRISKDINKFIGIKHNGELIDLTYILTNVLTERKKQSRIQGNLLDSLQNYNEYSFFVIVYKNQSNIVFVQPPVGKSGTITFDWNFESTGPKIILYWLENLITAKGVSI